MRLPHPVGGMSVFPCMAPMHKYPGWWASHRRMPDRLAASDGSATAAGQPDRCQGPCAAPARWLIPRRL